MSEQNLRLVDLFKSLDKDQSMSLTREEFIEGLKVSVIQGRIQEFSKWRRSIVKVFHGPSEAKDFTLMRSDFAQNRAPGAPP